MQVKFKVKRAKNGEVYGQIIAANGKELFRTSETYKRRAGVMKAFDAFIKVIIACSSSSYEAKDFVDDGVEN